MWKVACAFVLGALAGFAIAVWVRPAESRGDGRDVTDDGEGAASPRPPDRVRTPATRRNAPDPEHAADSDGAAGERAVVVTRSATQSAPVQGASLLEQIAAELRNPSPPGDGLRAFQMAGTFAPGPQARFVDLTLLRALFAGPGHSGQGGRVLLRFAEPSAAAAEIRRMVATGEKSWPGSLPGEVLAGLLQTGAGAVADEDVAALLATGNERVRLAALDEAVRRGSLRAEDLLRISRTDTQTALRTRALEVLVQGIESGRSDRGVVTAEVLRVARDPADPNRESAIEALGAIGPDGARLAAELFAAEGLPPHLVESVARTLVAGGRFDALEGTTRSGESRRRMLRVVGEAMEDDDATVDRAAIGRMLRTLRIPEDTESASVYFEVAVTAGAADIAVEAAGRRDLAASIRAAAACAVIESGKKDLAASMVAVARALLEDQPLDASARREFLIDQGSEVLRSSPDGRALVARIAERDADPWVRQAAASILADESAR